MSDGSVIEIQPHEQVLLALVAKRALDDESARSLVDDVSAAAAQRPNVPIVLDLSRLRFAPSVALGALVQLSNSFKFERRRIVLINVDGRVRETIRVTQLDKVLEIRESLQQVLGTPGK